LENAIAHYLTWRSDGRAHVLDKYDETIGWIEWNPDLFPSKSAACSERSSSTPTSRCIISKRKLERWYWPCWTGAVNPVGAKHCFDAGGKAP
jgi:hypothetical protein